MANSVRQDILTQLAADLAKITTANKYTNNISSSDITSGYLPLAKVNQYPKLFYGLGGEELTGTDEENGLLVQKCNAFIGVYFQNADLTAEYEKWIRDFKRLFWQDTKMSSYSALQTIDGVESWEITEIMPYMENSTGSILITLEIKYTESIIEGL